MKRFDKISCPDEFLTGLKKTLLVMKISIFLMFTSVLSIIANGTYSQNTNLSLKLKSVTVEQALLEIENNSEFFFLYNSKLIDVARKVNVNAKDRKVYEVLDELFKGQDIDYIIRDRQIILAPKSYDQLYTSHKMQGKLITGKILSDDGTPLPGANIVEKGTTNGAISDENGNFSLTVSSETATIAISFIDYITQEIVVGTQTEFNVKLLPDLLNIDEVVIIGYGVQKKSLVTGAISSVKGDDLKGSSAFVENQLQGKTSGVSVLPTSGAPGASIKVRIRGTSSNGVAEPLYIVDGTKVADIMFLDPNDIESIEVLKDGASSAIYGAEGGNGVILITTKKGKAGGEVNYSFQYGIQSPNKYAELMDADQYATYLTENGVADAGGFRANTNWMEEIFKNAPIQKHYLSISGGTDKSSIISSISYLNQDGIVGGSKANYNRITGRINGDYQAKKWLSVGMNIGYTFADRKAVTEDTRLDGIIARALLIDPLTPTVHADDDLDHIQANIDNGLPYRKDASGQYYGVSRYTNGEIVNPLLSIDILKGSTKRNEVSGNSYLKITPIEGLALTTRLGYGFANQDFHFWTPTYYYSAERNVSSTSVTDNMDTYARWQWENFATYTKSISKHNFAVTAGISMEQRYHRYLNATTGPMAIEDESFAEHDYTIFSTQRVRGNLFQDRLASYFGRLSYDYDGKYLFEASLRRDGAGTSKLPVNSNWGTFPSVSAGWVLSNESFWSIDFISFAKARASWGQNGSLSNLPYYSYSNDMSSEGLVYPTPAGKLAVFEPYSLGNSGLTWETSQQFDAGIDLRFLQNKLNLTVDYFNKKTLDLLTLGTPSATAGASSPYYNAGDVENKGIEVDLGFQNKEQDFKYGINFHFTSLKNEVTRLDSNISIIYGATLRPSWTGATAFSENQPIWYFRGYKTNGIDPTTGQPIFVDVKKDGVINAEDVTYIGDPHPDFLFGVNLNCEYKGLDLAVSVQGSKGNDVLLGWLRDDRSNINYPAFRFEDRWTPSHTNASQPRMDVQSKGNPNGLDPRYYQSDLLVFDGSYIKIRQIQLGYTLPTSLLNTLKINKARIFVSLDDFFTFTKYKGMDPEAGSTNNQSQGIDSGVYPTPRKMMFGCSLTF